jgi:hypothetical protein
MTRRSDRSTPRLRVEPLEARVVPAASVYNPQPFDSVRIGSLPDDWQSWNTSSIASFGASNLVSLSGAQSLASSGTNFAPVRAWWSTVFPSNFGVQATYLADATGKLQLFARGSNLNSAQASYYAVNLSASGIDLVRVSQGHEAVLSSVRFPSPASQWLQASLLPEGDRLSVEIYRADTGQYLGSNGAWQATPTLAIQLNDGAIRADGLVGVSRPTGTSGKVWIDDFGVVTPNVVTSTTASASVPPVVVNANSGSSSASGVQENFDSSGVGSLPAGWAQWSSSEAPNRFAVAGSGGFSLRGLASMGMSNTASRAWYDSSLASDVQVSASIYLDTLIPAQVFARGTNLNTSTPTYYSASVTRDLTVQLLRTVNGQTTVLGSLRSATYVSDKWVRLTLTAVGDRLRVQLQRLDTNQYLTPSGAWQAAAVTAIEVQDGSIRGDGRVGVARSALYYGNVVFDNFQAGPLTGDTQPPSVSIDLPGQTLSGTTRVSVSATDSSGIERVEFSVDGTVVKTINNAPFVWDFDTLGIANGTHTLTVKAIDRAGNSAATTRTFQVQNTSVAPPGIPRHYSHIRIAQLAYHGNPLGAYEQQLLRDSVDLVIPYTGYLDRINQTAPNTPQLIYTNASNLYLSLLTDWLNYADRVGASRESAFYHVSQATQWTGGSPSSQPVNWFWNVQRTGTYLTELARGSSAGFSLGGIGESTNVGYPDKFRELNFNVRTAPSSFYSYVVEYVSAVDANGNPTAWKRLTINSDSTAALRASGRMTFDPPADWKAAVLNGSTDRLFYVRVRNTSFANGPVVRSILGRDYAGANGGSTGVIPAFDSNADRDGDGYLNDSEYQRRAAGKDARFVYESRLFYPYYGQQRFVSNPASSAYQNWVVDYHTRLLKATPLADGLFVDNSAGALPLDGAQVIEPTSSYTADYASMLGNLNRRIAPKWVIANTAGSGSETTQVARQVPGTLEEFALRPLATNWTRFEDVAELVRARQAANPAGYLILDSLPSGGSPTDPRTQIATLAYYYLLGNPDTTFLMFNGGFGPATPWQEHWSPAAAYNVGQPQGTWSNFATGNDPTNASLTYKVMQRRYSNALVLYKPLSFSPAGGTGTLADGTATTHQLDGNYRQLRADGTLGPVTRSVTLRNGEGAILIRA